MLFGQLPMDVLGANAVSMAEFGTAPVVLRDVIVVQINVELEMRWRGELVPPALHPTTPPLGVVWVWQFGGGEELGPFTMAQFRVGCRHGARARALVRSGFVDAGEDSTTKATAAAMTTKALASRWGLPTRPAEVVLRRRFDRTDVLVGIDGDPVFAATAHDPRPMGVHDQQYVTSLLPVRGAQGLRLLQLDAEIAPERLERAEPEVHAWNGEALYGAPVQISNTISATIASATVTLPRLRFLADPSLPAHEGTITVGTR